MQILPTDTLIVVDVQNDFVSGTMAIPEAKKIIPPINALHEALPITVIATDWHPTDHVSFASAHPGKKPGDAVDTYYGAQKVHNDHCVQGTWGAELDPDLKLGKAQLVIRKGYRAVCESNGCFYENDAVTKTGLTEYLRARGVKRVFCTGLARFGCVMQSALGAARDGFEVYMVDDGSAGRPSPNDEIAMKKLADAGVRWIHSTELTGKTAQAA